ncbi:MAG: CopG family transcriptional regulator [Egibacteraceae bacterium]
MATEKVSLTLDEKVLAAAREQVGERRLSAYVNDAVERQLQRDRLREFLDEAEAEAGPIPDEIMEQVRREWPAPARERLQQSNTF